MDNIPELVDPVYDHIREVPGVDTPTICLSFLDDWEENLNPQGDPVGSRTGRRLANWLMQHHWQTWSDTCKAVDWCLAQGTITFGDNGELNCVG